MKIRALLLSLLLAAAACSSPSSTKAGIVPGGEIEVTAEIENLTVTPREGDLVTLLFRINNNTRSPVILRDLSQPIDLMLSGSSGAVASWQYAQSGLLTYLADRDEWLYDKGKRADVRRPVFNSGLLVPKESLALRARVRLLEMPIDFQFSYFELTEVFFQISDFVGGGFAYSPSTDRLYYNSGADGHLIGPWYWWIDD